ncbi:MAG: RNA 2',3'-cyclic phosphodiesterase [Pseudomonas sp.]
MAQSETSHLRLFFALPVPAESAMQIEQWRAELGLEGTLTLRDNLHLTLAFLGAQPRSNLPLFERLVAQLQGRAFELQLRQIACWHNGLLHLAPAPAPTELLALQQQLAQALTDAGLACAPNPYRPHLTLARHSRMPANPEPRTFRWQVREFALFASCRQGPHPYYQLLQRWPLQH